MRYFNHLNFINKAKIEYKKINFVDSPAFNGERIYFNKYGFNHLVRKQKNLRSREEQVRRLELLASARLVLISSRSIDNYRTNVIDNYTALFWSIKGNVDGKEIKVIVRQLGNGRKHFFSVMDKNNIETRKTPKGLSDSVHNQQQCR